MVLCGSKLFPQETSEEQGGEALETDQGSSASSNSTPPISPSCLSESPTSPTDGATIFTKTSSVKPRRRSGRPRPRPMSDYGQLISRKHSIPEEVAELHNEERTHNMPSHKEYSNKDAYGNVQTCSNGNVKGVRQRPISVIGGMDLLPPDSEEKDDCLPTVSIYSYRIDLITILCLINLFS